MSPTEAIEAALIRAGITTQVAQAAVIGEHPVQWARYVHGHRSPQCSKVARWLESTRAEGYELRIDWDADGARATPDEAIAYAIERATPESLKALREVLKRRRLKGKA
jgi:hypothetical protein